MRKLIFIFLLFTLKVTAQCNGCLPDILFCSCENVKAQLPNGLNVFVGNDSITENATDCYMCWHVNYNDSELNRHPLIKRYIKFYDGVARGKKWETPTARLRLIQGVENYIKQEAKVK